MKRIESPWTLVPDVFSDVDEIAAGFTGRTGGVSDAPYRSLNLGLSTGDSSERVLENRRRVFELFGVGLDRLAVAGQVHGSEVLVASEPGLYPGFDALVTTAPGLVLCITSADFAVVLLADADSRVAAACHSGWRGTVEGVAVKTVRRMVECGADPRRMRAYVSPCICADHFEVGLEVAARFAPEHIVERPEWRRPHVDLRAAVAAQLEAEGLASNAIEVSDHCTFDETDRFFSYRAEGGKTGRMMGFIFLRSPGSHA